MESWTWGDVFLYFVCTAISIVWYFPLVGIIIFLLKFPLFLLVSLPYEVFTEFKMTSFERRSSDRTYSTLFQFTALSFTRWVLRTFQPAVTRNVFFGELHARVLYGVRRFKYGTENIGDFDYFPHKAVVPSFLVQDTESSPPTTKGYWVRSKSRRSTSPDLVVYFVPGNLAGCASSYIYLEFLSMLLVELQVQGFRNPVIYCLDAEYYNHSGAGFEQYVLTVQNGWHVASTEFPRAKTMFMGSGIGGTALLSLLLHIARPTAGLLPLPKKPSTELKGDTSLPSAIDLVTVDGESRIPPTDWPASGSPFPSHIFDSSARRTPFLDPLYPVLDPVRNPPRAFYPSGSSILSSHGNSGLGSQNSVSGSHNSVLGSHNSVLGLHNSALGSHNSVLGSHNSVSGSQNSVLGSHNSVSGSNNSALGSHDAALGSHSLRGPSLHENLSEIDLPSNLLELGSHGNLSDVDSHSNLAGSRNSVDIGSHSNTAPGIIDPIPGSHSRSLNTSHISDCVLGPLSLSRTGPPNISPLVLGPSGPSVFDSPVISPLVLDTPGSPESGPSVLDSPINVLSSPIAVPVLSANTLGPQVSGSIAVGSPVTVSPEFDPSVLEPSINVLSSPVPGFSASTNTLKPQVSGSVAGSVVYSPESGPSVLDSPANVLSSPVPGFSASANTLKPQVSGSVAGSAAYSPESGPSVLDSPANVLSSPVAVSVSVGSAAYSPESGPPVLDSPANVLSSVPVLSANTPGPHMSGSGAVGSPVAGSIPEAFLNPPVLRPSAPDPVPSSPISPSRSFPSRGIPSHSSTVLGPTYEPVTAFKHRGYDPVSREPSIMSQISFNGLISCASDAQASLHLEQDGQHDSSGVIIHDHTSEHVVPAVRKPDAVLLVSPLARISRARKDKYPDFMVHKVLSHLSQVFTAEQGGDRPCSMPGCIQSSEWWDEAIPARGIAVYYGGNETQRPEIEQLIELMRSAKAPRVVSQCRDDEVHAWPITGAYTGRTTTDQIDGVRQVANDIAKMLVMDCMFASSSAYD